MPRGRGSGRGRGKRVEKIPNSNPGPKFHDEDRSSAFNGQVAKFQSVEGESNKGASSGPLSGEVSVNGYNTKTMSKNKWEQKMFSTGDNQNGIYVTPGREVELDSLQQRKVYINGANNGVTEVSGFKREVVEELNADFKEKFHLNSKMAPRPGFGVNGNQVDLISNYFPLLCKTKFIYHYDVEINSLDMKKKYGKQFKTETAAEAAQSGKSFLEHQQARNVGRERSKEIFAKLVNSKALKQFNPMYDGFKNVYTTSPLPFKKKEIIVIEMELDGKSRKYEITIQPVIKNNGGNTIDVDAVRKMYSGGTEVPYEILAALNTVMNYRAPQSKQMKIGRSFFCLDQTKKLSVGEGIEIWFGYNQNIHFTQKGPAVVLNLAAKAFHKAGPVIEYVNDILRRDITRGSFLKPYEVAKVEEALKGVRITVTHLPYLRKYYIQGISKLSADNLVLPVDGKKVSVAQYFQSKYGKLQFPHLPCVHVRSYNNRTYIPFEKCIIPVGQPKLGKLSNIVANGMIKHTAILPAERFKDIAAIAKDVQKQSSEQIKNFDLFMELQPTNVKGRVIAPPALEYFCQPDSSQNVCQPDSKGVWRMDGKKFFRTSEKIKSWIFLSFADKDICSYNVLNDFAKRLWRVSEKVGLCFGKFLGVEMINFRDTTKSALKMAKESGASFAVIVLSKRDHHHSYEELKFIADYKMDYITQCVDTKQVLQPSEQVVTNLCLKINVKLGGVNHILRDRPVVFKKPVIVFGADAVHAARGSGCPSIASVVGSLDAFPSKYKLACRVQENPDVKKQSQELILQLKDMVENILLAFKKHTNGKYPEKMIFFRDGVSEGQFEKVRDFEVSEVMRASYDVIGAIVPLTFIVVQKRHQTRFRPRNPKDGLPSGNILPGTTVDNGITHPVFFDYYLCSHEGIRGTSKPAHYTVLYDDNNFSPDEIQKLSYHLCHMYGKCNRSVSIPAPVMYADLAAYRAKKYADWHLSQLRDRDSVSSSSSNSSCKLPDHVKEAINNMGNISNNMFYV